MREGDEFFYDDNAAVPIMTGSSICGQQTAGARRIQREPLQWESGAFPRMLQN